MAGRLAFYICLVMVLCTAQGRQQCDMFRQEYCNPGQDTVLMVDTKISSPQECQTACFEKERCSEFTFFTGETTRCVFFKSCGSQSALSCDNCISGPAFPRVATCLIQARRDRRRKQGGGRSRSGSERLKRPLRTRLAQQREGQSNETDEPDIDYEDELDNEVNIDDGLLDAIFNDLPGTDEEEPLTTTPKPPPSTTTKPPTTTTKPPTTTTKPPTTTTKPPTTTTEPPTTTPKPPTTTAKSSPKDQSPRKSSNQGECPLCDGYYYCVMGGSNAKGPISTVSVMNIGITSVPSNTIISSFPSSMTQGNGLTFSSFSTSLRTCTPGYQISTFQNNNVRSLYVPGSCNGYDFSTEKWTSTGGKMAAFRDGGSELKVGSYILTLGGFDQRGKKMSSVELFDPRRPGVGWQEVPQWSFPRATKDQCTVVTKDTTLGSQVLVTGGLGEERSVMRLVLSTNNWYSVPRMKHPRSQHGCTSITLNGRPGVMVSGGTDTNRFNTPSVEFFDMKTQKWIDLPSLKRGRHGHTMSTIYGKLVVAGGVATGNRGEEEYLDDVEEFDGRRWKKASYKLDQPRRGANLVKIPIREFKG